MRAGSPVLWKKVHTQCDRSGMLAESLLVFSVLLNTDRAAHLGFIPQGETVSTLLSCNIITHLRENFQCKQPKVWLPASLKISLLITISSFPKWNSSWQMTRFSTHHRHNENGGWAGSGAEMHLILQVAGRVVKLYRTSCKSKTLF